VIGTLQTSRPAPRFALRARPFDLIGGALLRYGLVAFFLLFGLAKFTPAEAQTIQPWVANSPFLGWLYALTSVQGGSNLIGVVELITAVLLAVRPWLPRVSVVGSLAAIVTFLITLSFLFTTPDLSPEWQGFLMKDVILLGAAVWTAGDTLRAIERKANSTK
jgi:uncharacterized membrane protein YkgB